MKKPIVRIISFLLIPCMLVEPAAGRAWSQTAAFSFRQAADQRTQYPFQEQTLALRHRYVGPVLSRIVFIRTQPPRQELDEAVSSMAAFYALPSAAGHEFLDHSSSADPIWIYGLLGALLAVRVLEKGIAGRETKTAEEAVERQMAEFLYTAPPGILREYGFTPGMTETIINCRRYEPAFSDFSRIEDILRREMKELARVTYIPLKKQIKAVWPRIVRERAMAEYLYTASPDILRAYGFSPKMVGTLINCRRYDTSFSDFSRIEDILRREMEMKELGARATCIILKRQIKRIWPRVVRDRSNGVTTLDTPLKAKVSNPRTAENDGAVQARVKRFLDILEKLGKAGLYTTDLEQASKIHVLDDLKANPSRVQEYHLAALEKAWGKLELGLMKGKVKTRSVREKAKQLKGVQTVKEHQVAWSEAQAKLMKWARRPKGYILPAALVDQFAAEFRGGALWREFWDWLLRHQITPSAQILFRGLFTKEGEPNDSQFMVTRQGQPVTSATLIEPKDEIVVSSRKHGSGHSGSIAKTTLAFFFSSFSAASLLLANGADAPHDGSGWIQLLSHMGLSSGGFYAVLALFERMALRQKFSPPDRSPRWSLQAA